MPEEYASTIDDAARQVAELLAPLGPVVVESLLGTWGLYLEDRVFGLVHDGTVYFKTEPPTAGRYLACGCASFQYRSSDGTCIDTPYHAVPLHVLADRDEACAWAFEALAAGI